ncbi:MAG: tRNA lysidine(34) synthetase TilS [Flavobacteriaceae bacterium]|nr:tRNA lysidine(34) synthetase TilS [Flavobacteriaceae bacterium]MBT6705466.1 tRNA lysidine(34) synthetase TilS [Flavobacteriaceae bacterium]
MLTNFKNHISNNFPALKGKKILIACSGGLDSVVLSRLFKELNYNISLAHCNFSLRGKESDEDEKFVISLAGMLSIPVFNKKFNTKAYKIKHKLSTQVAARKLRYQWFDEVCAGHSFDYLATAHHLDDDLETFLINLSRGTGLKGLTGIPVMNDKIIRPFLNFPRADILYYAKEKNSTWREDSSNQTTDYLRNKLRIEVIPRLKEVDLNLLNGFQQTQKNLNESASLVNDYMALIKNLIVNKTDEGFEIDIFKLQELPNTNALLYELLAPFGFTAWNDISNLLVAQSGKQIFSETHRIIKNRTSLLLVENNLVQDQETYLIKESDKRIDVPINLKIEQVEKTSDYIPGIVYLDAQKLKFPLQLRKWQEGDLFYPFGMTGKKKLSKFFKDEKLSLLAKEKTWVLTSSDDIVWIVGIRADHRFKVESQTKSILKITLYKNSQ